MTRVVAVLFLFVAASCNRAPSVSNSWSTKLQRKPMSKVMLITLLPNSKTKLQLQLEQQLAEAFAQEGYLTTTAYAEFGPNAFKGLAEKTATSRLKSASIDGVLVISLLNPSEETSYASGSVSYDTTSKRIQRWWPYYSNYKKKTANVSYYMGSDKNFIETHLYHLGINQLIYAAQSAPFDPAKSEKITDEYVRSLVKNMKENNLLMKNHQQDAGKKL